MSVVTARISDELNKSLFEIAKKIERPKSYIIAKAIEAYVQELQEDMEDYNDAIEILAQNNKTISWQEVQRKHGLLDN